MARKSPDIFHSKQKVAGRLSHAKRKLTDSVSNLGVSQLPLEVERRFSGLIR